MAAAILAASEFRHSVAYSTIIRRSYMAADGQTAPARRWWSGSIRPSFMSGIRPDDHICTDRVRCYHWRLWQRKRYFSTLWHSSINGVYRAGDPGHDTTASALLYPYLISTTTRAETSRCRSAITHFMAMHIQGAW